MFIIAHKNFWLWLALGVVITSAIIVANFGLKFGIDFTGGTLMEVTYSTAPDRSAVDEIFSKAGIENPLIRHSNNDAGSAYLITTRTLTNEEINTLGAELTALGQDGVITRNTTIGPVIGKELKDKAVWAIGAVLLITIVYVAFAFAGIGKPVSSWIYGIITVSVLGHDILVPIAAMSLLGHFEGAEVDILFVTAILTILGYSVNDTIVIFDRVREKLVLNRTEHKRTITEPGGVKVETTEYTLTKPFSTLVGQAISETMVRSINTSLTVIIALVVLYLFGSSVTQNFIFALMVGVFAGAFSSIFIASPLLVTYANWQERRNKTMAK